VHRQSNSGPDQRPIGGAQHQQSLSAIPRPQFDDRAGQGKTAATGIGVIRRSHRCEDVEDVRAMILRWRISGCLRSGGNSEWQFRQRSANRTIVNSINSSETPNPRDGDSQSTRSVRHHFRRDQPADDRGGHTRVGGGLAPFPVFRGFCGRPACDRPTR